MTIKTFIISFVSSLFVECCVHVHVLLLSSLVNILMKIVLINLDSHFFGHLSLQPFLAFGSVLTPHIYHLSLEDDQSNDLNTNLLLVFTIVR